MEFSSRSLLESKGQQNVWIHTPDTQSSREVSGTSHTRRSCFDQLSLHSLRYYSQFLRLAERTGILRIAERVTASFETTGALFTINSQCLRFLGFPHVSLCCTYICMLSLALPGDPPSYCLCRVNYCRILACGAHCKSSGDGAGLGTKPRKHKMPEVPSRRYLTA